MTVTSPALLPVPPKPPTLTCTLTLAFFGDWQLLTTLLIRETVQLVPICKDSVLAPPPTPPPPPIDCARMPLEPGPKVTMPPVCSTCTSFPTLPSPPKPPTETATLTALPPD